jgi:hypothetical protein
MGRDAAGPCFFPVERPTAHVSMGEDGCLLVCPGRVWWFWRLARAQKCRHAHVPTTCFAHFGMLLQYYQLTLVSCRSEIWSLSSHSIFTYFYCHHPHGFDMDWYAVAYVSIYIQKAWLMPATCHSLVTLSDANRACNFGIFSQAICMALSFPARICHLVPYQCAGKSASWSLFLADIWWPFCPGCGILPLSISYFFAGIGVPCPLHLRSFVPYSAGLYSS